MATGWDVGDVHDVYVDSDGEAWFATDWVIMRAQHSEEAGWEFNSPTKNSPLYAISGRDNEVIAVGQGGAIYQGPVKGGGFDVMEVDNVDADYRGLWCSDESLSYFCVAVGTGGTIVVAFETGNWFKMYAFGDSGDLTANLNDVAGIDNWDVFAVGDEGTIMRYNGKHWGQMQSPTDEDLVGVASSPNGFMYGISDQGTVITYTGQEWVGYVGALDGTLNAISSGPAMPTIVGDGGAAYALSGKAMSWSDVSLDTDANLLGMWKGGAKDQWIVGQDGLILRFE